MTTHDDAERAKRALEWVCSGSGRAPAARYYSPHFLDHVNDRDFFGLAGATASVELYRTLLSEIRIDVQDQVVQGDRVVSRFVVSAVCHGRPVRFHGITISRFEDGMIVEDWSVTDTLGMLRQLGPKRAVLIAVKTIRALASAQSTGRIASEGCALQKDVIA